MDSLCSKLFLLLLAASVISHGAVTADPIPSHRALVAPLTKHTATSLYTITLNSQQHSLLIDLDAPFTWYNCITPHNSVPCRIPPCQQARSYSYASPSCPPPPSNTTTKYGCSVCDVTPVNPVTRACAVSVFTYDFVHINWTDGTNPTSTMNILQVGLSCAPRSLLKSFPQNATGVLSLSQSPLSLPSQFSHSFLGVANRFAICLSSWDIFPGVIFFGDGPYNFMHDSTNLDATGLLSYTPLLENKKSPGYYIHVKSIWINGKAIRVPVSSGNTTAQLSTVVPYTTLRSDVYKLLVTSFSNATKGIPRMKAVKPFSLCLKASLIGTTRIGFWVPPIDLQMGNGKNWTIYGTNSIKSVGNDVACLAFVDGGKTAEQSMVIGSFQMENYFLLFDLEKSRLGFSSTLFFSRTSCAQFNFTMGSLHDK